MANKTIGMTQVKRIIQLRSEGTSKLKISKQVGIHRNTLDDYLFKLELTGKSYQELLEMSQEELASIVYCAVGNTKKPDYRLDHLKNNFNYYARELRKAGVTRRILWEEYKQSHPDGYGYTQFCEHLARYNKVLKATMHFEHEPARYLQVDFAGKPLHFIDRETGEVIACPVLVCVLPFSGYPYIEALRSARQEELFNSLSRCVEFFGGVAYNILSDNMKQFMVHPENE